MHHMPVLIQHSSQAQGNNHVGLCCGYTHPDKFANHRFKSEENTCRDMGRNNTTEVFSSGYKAPLCYAVWQHLCLIS